MADSVKFESFDLIPYLDLDANEFMGYSCKMFVLVCDIEVIHGRSPYFTVSKYLRQFADTIMIILSLYQSGSHICSY